MIESAELAIIDSPPVMRLAGLSLAQDSFDKLLFLLWAHAGYIALEQSQRSSAQ